MKAILALLLLAATAAGREYQADVIRVIDGDTVVVNLHLGQSVMLIDQPVRIANANAPEKSTAAGVVSKGWLEVLLTRKRVTIITNDKRERDSFGRILGRIVLNGEDVGEKAKAEHMAHDGPGKMDPRK